MPIKLVSFATCIVIEIPCTCVHYCVALQGFYVTKDLGKIRLGGKGPAIVCPADIVNEIMIPVL